MLLVSVGGDPFQGTPPDLGRRPVPRLQAFPQNNQIELGFLQPLRHEAGSRHLELDGPLASIDQAARAVRELVG